MRCSNKSRESANRLKKQADELDAIVAGLKQRLEKLNIDLAETRSEAATAHTESRAQVQELETQLAARDKSIDEYLAKLKRAAELFSKDWRPRRSNSSGR